MVVVSGSSAAKSRQHSSRLEFDAAIMIQMGNLVTLQS